MRRALATDLQSIASAMSLLLHAPAPEDEWHCVTPVPIPPRRSAPPTLRIARQRYGSRRRLAIAIASLVVALIVAIVLRGTS